MCNSRPCNCDGGLFNKKCQPDRIIVNEIPVEGEPGQNIPATLSTIGGVLMGETVPDSATSPTATYSAAQVQSIIAELRALKQSLIDAGTLNS